MTGSFSNVDLRRVQVLFRTRILVRVLVREGEGEVLETSARRRRGTGTGAGDGGGGGGSREEDWRRVMEERAYEG